MKVAEVRKLVEGAIAKGLIVPAKPEEQQQKPKKRKTK
jgi:hypothetical protein